MSNASPSGWGQIKSWRRKQRQMLLQQREAVSTAQRQCWDAAIESSLRALLPERIDRTIGCYWPVKGEYDARALIGELVERGARAALPAVVTPRKPLEFWLWRPGEALKPGAYQIPVPRARQVVEPDVLLAPLVGFDAAGYRLGYGSGYFDRTLAALPGQPFVIGIGYEFSRLETIYPQAHDIPMTVIVTEQNTYWSK